MAATVSERARRVNEARLRRFGTAIEYRPAGGAAEPIAATAVLLRGPGEQSASPGEFAAIEVDPLVIVEPRKDDVVVWADGVEYEVVGVGNAPYGLTTLKIHRKAPAVDEVDE